MSTPDDYTRIGIALNPRQVARLRAMTTRTGVSQTALLTACIDVLTDLEVFELIKRQAQVKVAAYAAKVLGEPYVEPL